MTKVIALKDITIYPVVEQQGPFFAVFEFFLTPSSACGRITTCVRPDKRGARCSTASARDHGHVRDAFSFAFDRPRVASGRRGDGYKFVA